MIDDRTPNLNLPKPNALNFLSEDVDRLRSSLDSIDTAVAGKQASLGFTPENTANKGAANGYASLGSDGKVPSAQLPSYVDDVLEYASTSAFPASGETGKIYVAINAGTAADPTRAYRWSGSAYVEISPSPGTTDNVVEGSTNLYFTAARAKLASANGALNKSAAYTIVAADSKSLVRVSTASGAVTITLPQISTLTQDFEVLVAKVTGDTNAVTIARSGSDVINGASSYSLSGQWQGAWFIADRSTNTWTVISSGSSNAIAQTNADSFTGSGTAGPFTLSGDPGAKVNTAVYVGGVYQQKSTYTLSGTSLTLGGTVATGVSIEVIWSQPLQIGVTTASQTTASDGASGTLFGNMQDFIAAARKFNPLNDAIKRRRYVIGVTGQSNARGAYSGGPNPASSLVKTWDGFTGTWGGSDYTGLPWSRTDNNGNSGNNNIALALAHRIANETGAQVYIVYDALSGVSIDQWVATGTTSARYAAFKTKVEAALATTELSGVTELDCLIYAQGEEDALTMDYATYLGKFTTLDQQFRAESWVSDTMPIMVMGMSYLHTRYQVWQAQFDYCENTNSNCIYVNSMGLKTLFSSTGTGDDTHWLADSLWEFGYHRAWYTLQERSLSSRQPLAPFYARSAGPWRGQTDAIALFNNLVSRDSATSEFPLTGPSASGSISWGFQCSSDGNYSMCGGYQVTNDNLTNYSFGWGRSITFDANGDYAGGFGYQNALNATYSFAAGRGHTVVDSGGSAFGLFSRYTTTQTNNVIFQIGVGTSTSARNNAFTARADGNVELNVNHTSDPTQNKEICFEWVSNTSLKIKMRGSDGVVRSASLTMA